MTATIYTANKRWYYSFHMFSTLQCSSSHDLLYIFMTPILSMQCLMCLEYYMTVVTSTCVMMGNSISLHTVNIGSWMSNVIDTQLTAGPPFPLLLMHYLEDILYILSIKDILHILSIQLVPDTKMVNQKTMLWVKVSAGALSNFVYNTWKSFGAINP